VVNRRATIVLLALAAGCQSLEETVAAPLLDESAFRCEVEPVLAARCAFYPCHGSPLRPFRVYAPNRLRLDPPRPPTGYRLGEPLTAAEHRANYEMARQLAYQPDFDGSLLLLKPLAVEAGGLFHGGRTLYGGADVFDSPSDRGYRLIERWLAGGTAADDCTPTGDVGR
jgi:hypothetical protein